jgi:ribosomal protein L33
MLYICETKDFDMTTITINKRTKAGKLILKWQSFCPKKKKAL